MTAVPNPIDQDVDVDEIAVERACKGDRNITLNRAEAAEAFRRLDSRGLSAHEIAEVLGTTQRTIVRWRTGDAHPITRPGATGDATIKEKIATALKSSHTPVRRAAVKANQALATLDSVLVEWDTKEAARERVAELERELAEAKAALRTPAKKNGAVTSLAGDEAKARAWAQKNNVQVPVKGRVPSAVVEQWRKATGGQS